ncbi:M42 family metallopeptidase [Sphingosinicella rhizophila]|uniref:M28 family peptidase n=1 Tax=Sphingosinicella rhizophila TaxID=3050082 RepID=A0ABU3QCX3_9SPHN|nr:M28 family peptidase [Sphingosinicella sp. GR2756]MDT9600994.1 M28 family peptidase [Sphingosinicella sp. GR2756]
MRDDDALFEAISELVMCHSPSGREMEIDVFLTARFQQMGLRLEKDASENLIVKFPGSGRGSIAITAHKDEIAAIVRAIEPDGRLRVRKLGGSFPWVYGEGVVDLLGSRQCISGILSFGSRHVSHASPQFVHKETKPLLWEDAWIETKLSVQEIEEAGVTIGTRMVVGRHRKKPFRLRDHIASYTLDNKASVAALVELARRIENPVSDIYLVFSSKEEVGAIGANYFAQRHHLDALVALEIAPIAPEYAIADDRPVLLAEDSNALYDSYLNEGISRLAESRSISLQMAALSGFGSDGSIATKYGNVGRAACLAFPTQNTHGYEIARLDVIAQCVDVLEALSQSDLCANF